MMPYPTETWEEYAVRYREGWLPMRDNLMMGTVAWGGPKATEYDISRDEPDYFAAWSETDENYVGNWITGFGFFDVRFPKDTSRPVTDEEWEWFLSNPVAIV